MSKMPILSILFMIFLITPKSFFPDMLIYAAAADSDLEEYFIKERSSKSIKEEKDEEFELTTSKIEDNFEGFTTISPLTPSTSTCLSSEKNKNSISNFDTMSMSKECCTRPPVSSNYEPKGTFFKLDDLTVYEVGNKSSKHLLISVYDIFGFHPNTKQFCDILAQGDYIIAMPDFFRGSPWNAENFPPKDFTELREWVGKAGSWENVAKPDIINVINHYKSQGQIDSVGIFGFCWGGKMSILAGAEIDEIKGAGLIHPSFVDEGDAEKVKCPVVLMPSQNEADMLPIQNKITERLGKGSCEHYRFDDMIHGFAAARGDFNDELNRKRVDEVLGYLTEFFSKHLKN